jgi:hypothetical protein
MWGCGFDAALGAVLRALAAFAATRLAAAFLATFAEILDVRLAIAFIPTARSSI